MFIKSNIVALGLFEGASTILNIPIIPFYSQIPNKLCRKIVNKVDNEKKKFASNINEKKKIITNRDEQSDANKLRYM